MKLFLRFIGKVPALILVIGCAGYAEAQPADSAEANFILAADISYIEELEINGAIFKEAGVPDDIFAIMARNGVNTIRLRLWHTPAEEWYDLESTVGLARRIKAAGLDFLLDFHFSDTWADPGRQTKPAAWAGLSFDLLRDSLYAYTHHVMTTLKDEDISPAYVQIGNEISQGLLWDEGRVGGNFNGASQWSQLRTLLNDASRAIRDVSGDDVQIIIHTDRGGDVAGATWFFDNITSQPVDFDMIGLSYYPWWHGSFEDMQHTINTVAAKYAKPVLIAETGYPWTLQWYDNTNNFVGLPEHLLPGYDDDLPDAQYRFLRDLIEIVKGVPDNRGAGISYWAPEFMAVPGVGSVWENVALFDNNGEVLPAIRAFAEAQNVHTEQPEINDVMPALEIYPNPFLQSFKLTFYNPIQGAVSIALYDTLGRKRVSVMEDRWLPAGPFQIDIDGSSLPPGLYLSTLQGQNKRITSPIIRR